MGKQDEWKLHIMSPPTFRKVAMHHPRVPYMGSYTICCDLGNGRKLAKRYDGTQAHTHIQRPLTSTCLLTRIVLGWPLTTGSTSLRTRLHSITTAHRIWR